MPEMVPLTRSTEATLERVGNEAILYDKARGSAHVLNGAAARLWELCDGESTIDEVTSTFAFSFGLTESAVREDVERVVSALRALHLLH